MSQRLDTDPAKRKPHRTQQTILNCIESPEHLSFLQQNEKTETLFARKVAKTKDQSKGY